MKNLYYTTYFILICLLPNINYAQDKVDHSAWDQILILNVSDEGMVDYDGVTNDVAVFYKYFRYLCTISPQESWSNEEKLAYWLNVYNATAMKMVIDEYPIKSIRDIYDPWKRKVFKSQGVRYSLDDIEHGILRKFNDPRIHFLLNCSSVSSPRLWNRAYSAENIDRALEERTREFINDPQRNQISSDMVRVSQIFDWYKEDFESNGISIINFINKYANVKIKSLPKDAFVNYNWNLNTQDKQTPVTSRN